MPNPGRPNTSAESRNTIALQHAGQVERDEQQPLRIAIWRANQDLEAIKRGFAEENFK